MRPPKVEERFCESRDGTRIAYHIAGEGPPILLANGLGGSWKAWSHQIAYFRDRCRFISWDYRGLYRSGPPPNPEALRVEDHVEDALAVLADVGEERVAILGWSMGVQVALELFRREPAKVAALILVNGVAGKPWATVLNLPQMEKVIPKVLGLVRSVPGITQSVTERVVQWPETVTWAKRVGLAGKTLDESIFAELAGSFSGLDMGLYMRTLELLGEHDATSSLPEIDVPVLMIAGDRDLFTPRSAAEVIAREVPGAELLVVPGGTHYVAVEYPELVNLRVEKFLRERGYLP